MARPSGLVASRSMRPLRTSAGPPVMESSTHDEAGARSPGRRLRRRALKDLAGSVGGLGEVEHGAAFGVVQTQGASDGVEDRGADPAQCAPFELGVEPTRPTPANAATSPRRRPGTLRCPTSGSPTS